MMSGRRSAGAALAALLSIAPLGGLDPVAFAGPPPGSPGGAPTNHPQAPKNNRSDPDPAPAPAKSEPSNAPSGGSSSAEAHPRCPYTTQQCLSIMASKMKAAGWIGIEYEPKDPDGPKVTKVVPGSPAEKAGLQPGDILFALNGVEMKGQNEEALAKARKEWKPGQAVQYTVMRNGAPKQVDVVLGEWPADILARYIGEHMLEHAQWDAEDAAKNAKNGKAPDPKK